MRFGPDAECFDLCLAVLLARGKTDIGRLACNAALDVVKRADTVESLAGNLGARFAKVRTGFPVISGHVWSAPSV